MVYLSTVRAGGATVFPALGLVVPPQEGTALFWHTINTQVYRSPLSVVWIIAMCSNAPCSG